MAADELEFLVSKLVGSDPAILALALEGCSTPEIAGQLGCYAGPFTAPWMGSAGTCGRMRKEVRSTNDWA